MGNATEMNAAIYSPYWSTLGGGEYYSASFARALGKLGYQVDLLSDIPDLISSLERRFGIDLDNIIVNTSNFQKFTKSIWSRRLVSKNYDLVFFVSDGSIPFLFSQKNILHFQVPFHDVKGKSIITQIKLRNISTIICNSFFTKNVIDKEFAVKSRVVYPAVKGIKASKKENLILSVGRFDNLMQSKRQDVLITAFKKLNLDKNWKLVLAGGVLHGQNNVKKLIKKIEGRNIQILTNVSNEVLKKLYSKAKIYWHAAGYDLDINKFPEKAEHFGISTVEAMSAGAIPIVYNAGGLKEIIEHNKTGYLYNSMDELISQTTHVINTQSKIIENIVDRGQHFSQGVFDDKVKKIVS